MREIPPGKHLLDVIVVVLALPLVLPLGLLIAISVFLDSPGPVFYRSRRIGRGGRPFAMLKFRTMVRDAAGPSLSARGDERYTPLGRRLAASRLDELPQLWNVIRGEMRLVGPRPELEEFVRAFPAEYERILSVPPGLTGPAQLQYAWEGDVLARAQAVDRARVYRDSILPLKVAIDLEYARRHGSGRDAALLALTAALPLRRLFGGLLPDEPGQFGRLVYAAGLAVLIATLAGLFVMEAVAPV